MKIKKNELFARFYPWALVVVLTYGAVTKCVAQTMPEVMTNMLFTVKMSPAQDRKMAWFRDAKYGLFIHWGLYAIPAGEW